MFQNMKRNQHFFAVVLDEYGGVTGIITLHDLMEELVGEFDDDEIEIERMSASQWQIQGTADLEDVQEEVGVPMPIEEYDTYNGFLCGLIGRVPDDGESFECEYENIKIKICEVSGHRIKGTIVEKISVPKSSD